MSFYPAPYFGRFQHGAPRHWGPPAASFNTMNDIAPLFRMVDSAIDNFVSPITAPWARRQGEANSAPTFQPRFDVKETDERYELRGELPGVEAENVEVKFADEQTLVIKGKTESGKTSGTPPSYANAVEGSTNDKAVADEAALHGDKETTSRRSSSGSYVKPTVEDDVEGNSAATATTTTAPAATPEQAKEASDQQQPEDQDKYQYWYSERSTGTFQRSFHFPSHVDQDAVVANLKNGVLDVVVPKRKIEEGRKITVGSGA